MQNLKIGGWTVPGSLVDLGTIIAAVLAALILGAVGYRLLRRFARRTPSGTDDLFVEAARRPMRWILVALALAASRNWVTLDRGSDAVWVQIAGLVVPLVLGWFAIEMIRAGRSAVEANTDISVSDNLHARRRRTRTAILARIAIVTVGFLTGSIMLLSIPSIRTVGVSLMASAGLAALAVGAAAQPALKNIIAGIQMAFTEPIRLDDVVIVEGEWGRVEEIRLTYVVIALWDERRLVVPVSRFLESPFQNWTRNSSQLLGAAFLYLDPTADIARLRARYAELVRANDKWDGRSFGMQVTDIKPEAIEVRVLATAANAGSTFDLRCDLREALLAYIRDEMPEALPRGRIRLDGDEIDPRTDDNRASASAIN